MASPQRDGLRAYDGAGNPIFPAEGSFPLLLKTGPRSLSVIGTAFWITRWGMFLTAAHVLENHLSEPGLRELRALHWGSEEAHLREIRYVTAFEHVDLAVGVADNRMESFQKPLMNRRAILTTTAPPVGSKVVTFAYPENRLLDFTDESLPVSIQGDYFEGEVLRYVGRGASHRIENPHFEVSMEIRSGASGGPVHDERGRVVAVNCSGWDFGPDPPDGHLSSVVPIEEIMPMKVDLFLLPPQSWEADQIPAGRVGDRLTVAEMCTYGLIDFQK